LIIKPMIKNMKKLKKKLKKIFPIFLLLTFVVPSSLVTLSLEKVYAEAEGGVKNCNIVPGQDTIRVRLYNKASTDSGDDGWTVKAEEESDGDIKEIEEEKKEGWNYWKYTIEVEKIDKHRDIAVYYKDSLVCGGEEGDHLEEMVTIKTHKIVCEDESYLPGWATAGAPSKIDGDTAQTWLKEGDNDDYCELVSGWEFEWAPEGTGNPGDNTEYGGGDWVTFGPTDGNGLAQTEVNLEEVGSRIEMREVFKSGYVEFAGKEEGPPSAEFYCDDDIAYYDNSEWIRDPENGETYHCVAFNALEEPEEPEGASIEVCKMIADRDGHVATSADGLPKGEFEIDIANNAEFDNAETVTFNTESFSPNKAIFGEEYNAECHMLDELDFEEYFFSEERIEEGYVWLTPQYNDQFDLQVEDVGDFFEYSPGKLFEDYDKEMEENNREKNADGHIVLSESRPHRQLVILNTYVDIPRYEGERSCLAGSFSEHVKSYDISSLEEDGKTFHLDEGSYLFKVSGTFNFNKNEDGHYADAGYSTKDNWVSKLADYGIKGIAPHYGAHALLADLGEGVGVVDWGDFDEGHEYTFQYDLQDGEVQFVIGDRWGDWFGTDGDNQAWMHDNEGSLSLDVYECVPGAVIKAHKVVCDDESLLPGWVKTPNDPYHSGNYLTKDDITGFVNDNDGCEFKSDWEFEWGYDGEVEKQDGDVIGKAGESKGWYDFDTVTGSECNPAIATIKDLSTSSKIWVREVLQDGYIPFAHPEEGWDTGERMESAELICHMDGYKYDNHEYIDDMEMGNQYYCVAFNVPEKEECDDIVITSDETNKVYPPKENDEVNAYVHPFTTFTNAVKTFIHDSWASITGAEWIWKTEEVANPEEDEVYYFEKHFDIHGTVSSATLEVAVDNSYKVWINDELIADRFDIEDNYSETKTYSIGYEKFDDTENVIKFKVKNWEQSGGTWETNPAGLLYRLDIERDTCYEPEPDPDPDKATIRAHKVICDDETDLPNWVKDRGYPSPEEELTEQKIIDYVNDSEGSCRFADEKWSFEWGYDGQVEREDGDHTGEAEGDNWHAFDSKAMGTSPALAYVYPAEGDKVWVREVLKDGYLPFSDHPGNEGTSVSAELICHTDGFNYDNYEYVDQMEAGEEYICVAFNVPLNGEIGNGGDNGNDNDIENEDPVRSSRGGVAVMRTPLSQEEEVEETLEEEPEGEVLGEATEEPCEEYLFEHIRQGANNNPEEVRKLQTFLNSHMGESLPVTGFYGNLTRAAVNRFQLEYKEEVLRPWVEAGIHASENTPTGYVFVTTKRWVNMIMCPELNIPLPDLSGYRKVSAEPEVAVTRSVSANGDILGEVDEEEEIMEMEEEEIVDVDEEEVEEEEEEPGREPMGRTGLWVTLITSVVLLGATIFYIMSPVK